MHSNEQVVRRHAGALSRGDMASALEDYDDDLVLHYPGRNAVSGDYRGKEELVKFLRRVVELTGGTFRVEVHDVLANDDHIALLGRLHAERDGRSFDWTSVDTFHVRDGKITEHWIHEGDQYLVDELLS